MFTQTVVHIAVCVNAELNYQDADYIHEKTGLDLWYGRKREKLTQKPATWQKQG